MHEFAYNLKWLLGLKWANWKESRDDEYVPCLAKSKWTTDELAINYPMFCFLREYGFWIEICIARTRRMKWKFYS